MEHIGTKRLETERLILRRFVASDAPLMYRNWASDPEVTKYLTWPPHASVEVSRRVLDSWLESYDKPDYYNWCIELKSLGEPIGSIGTVGGRDDIGMVHIGYCVGRPWWHQGIMGEALNALLDFFFTEVGANRVESRHDPHNPHSGMVMAHCGMTCEGTMRQADRNNQGICDYTMYGMLASEYAAR